jgi:putative ABC transport system permease protein
MTTALVSLNGIVMALGAVFGALDALYSAVSTLAVEIATLRVLGFGAIQAARAPLASALRGI